MIHALAILLLAGRPASASTPEPVRALLVEPSLAEPESFSRYTDRSASRADTAPAPVWIDAQAPAPARPALGPTPLPMPAAWRRRPVPEPRAILSSETQEAAARRALMRQALGIGSQVLGVSLLAAGLGLWKPRSRTGAALEQGVCTEDLPLLEEPAPTTPSPRAIPSGRGLGPAPRLPAPAPEPAMPWWAITAAEQGAIDRWDRSVEKEFGVFASFDEWLDAHARGLKGLDVELLKSKLRRDA